MAELTICGGIWPKSIYKWDFLKQIKLFFKKKMKDPEPDPEQDPELCKFGAWSGSGSVTKSIRIRKTDFDISNLKRLLNAA